MRRRPQEDDREQKDRQRADVARRRDPADQRRKGPGRSADDDILRGAPFEPDGVDQHVEQDRYGKDRSGQMIGGKVHQDDREDGQSDAEVERRLAGHPAGRKRAAGGPLHLGVEIGLIPLVERPGRPRAKRDAQHGGKAQHRVNRHRRGEQAAQPGEHHQAHHARLGQREQVAPIGGKALVVGQGNAGHAGPIRRRPRRGKGQRGKDLGAFQLHCTID